MTPLKSLLLFCFVIMVTKNFAQSIALYEQHNGRFDYTAIGNTLNLIENGAFSECSILQGSEAELHMPSGQSIMAAYLYWAGSGAGDFEVILNETAVTASRSFSHTLDSDRQFFAAFADITTLVIGQGNGVYSLNDLEQIDISEDYCSTGTNFAGWAMVVIYEDLNLPMNQINIYDGLEAVPDAITIELDNLNVLDVEGAKIGFIAWEGDVSLSINESLRMNGYLLSNPPLNPATNAFNGTNSFTGNSGMHNMDIDVYDIQNTINIGDTSATIELTSGQDLVMVNSIITVLNSQLPDASIQMADEVQSTCFSRTVVLEYTISNTNATDELPADTPIAFYIEDTLIAQSLTSEILPIGGTLNASISIDIDPSIPEQFEIIAVVDDLGDGNGIISEISETNNTASIRVEISNAGCPIFIPQGLSPNGDGLNDIFNILGLYDIFINHKLQIYNRYGTMVFEGDNNLKWDGSANRGPNPRSGKLPVGTYFYVLYLNEADYGPRSGWVYLNY